MFLAIPFEALPTETKVERGTSQSKRGASVDFSNSGHVSTVYCNVLVTTPKERFECCVRAAHPSLYQEREFFIDDLQVRIRFIVEMIWWTGLAPWEFESSFPGGLISTLQMAEYAKVSLEQLQQSCDYISELGFNILIGRAPYKLLDTPVLTYRGSSLIRTPPHPRTLP